VLISELVQEGDNGHCAVRVGIEQVDFVAKISLTCWAVANAAIVLLTVVSKPI
jgi:hypothetical protein